MDSSSSTDCASIKRSSQRAECDEFHPVVQELQDKIRLEGWEPLFNEAIQCARANDLALIRHISSLEAYLVDMNQLLYWVPEENADGNACYQRMAIFYFILNQPPLRRLQSGYSRESLTQRLTWLSQWTPRYALAMGEFLSSPDSISADSLRTFQMSKDWRLEDYEEPDGGFKDFNQFFKRKLKDGLRPISDDDFVNPAAIVSPADCRFEEAFNICKETTVTAKHVQWKVEKLLGMSAYRFVFRGGLFLHATLAPYNYHWFHAPLAGIVLETARITGQAALELKVKRNEHGNAYLDFREAIDSPGYQAAQTRGIMILKTAIGIVAVAAIGMAQVSSVEITIRRGQRLQKGAEMGFFQYGGSEIVLLFEKKSSVVLCAQFGEHWTMGTKIAQAVISK